MLKTCLNTNNFKIYIQIVIILGFIIFQLNIYCNIKVNDTKLILFNVNFFCLTLFVDKVLSIMS